jgi:hypothetical protein
VTVAVAEGGLASETDATSTVSGTTEEALEAVTIPDKEAEADVGVNAMHQSNEKGEKEGGKEDVEAVTGTGMREE